MSRDGRLVRATTGRAPHIYRPSTRNGYKRVGIYCWGEGRVWVYVHRAVCGAFNWPPPFKSALVRHLDNNKLNNHADNLAWGDDMANRHDRMEAEREEACRTLGGFYLPRLCPHSRTFTEDDRYGEVWSEARELVVVWRRSR